MTITILYLIMLWVPKNIDTKFQLILLKIEGMMAIFLILHFTKKFEL